MECRRRDLCCQSVPIRPKLSVTFDDRVTPGFGEFVQARLQALYDDYRADADVQAWSPVE